MMGIADRIEQMSSLSLTKFHFLGNRSPQGIFVGGSGLAWAFQPVMRWRCSMSPLCRCSFITTSFSQTNIHAYPWHLYKFELGGAKSVKSSPRRCYCLGEFLRCHQQDRLGSSRHSHSATAFREGIESGRVDFIWPVDWKGGSCHVLRCFQFFCYLCLKGVMWEQQEGVLHLVWEWCLHLSNF